MKPSPEHNFENNMNQLIQLLKKILTTQPGAGSMQDFASMMKGQGINLNLCFFTFFPLSPEDFDEFEEIYDNYTASEEDRRFEEMTSDLTASDLDFLRRNGIRF